MTGCLLLGAGIVSGVVVYSFANTYDLDNNLLATSNLPQPHYNDLAIYTYLRGVETDWCVLELARCVGVDGGHRGWQPGTLPKDFDFKVEQGRINPGE